MRSRSPLRAPASARRCGPPRERAPGACHRRPLHGSEVVRLLSEPVELHLRALRMRDLAPTEPHRELHLVPRLDEAPCRAKLYVEVVIVGLRPELQLLHLDHGLLPLRLAGP